MGSTSANLICLYYRDLGPCGGSECSQPLGSTKPRGPDWTLGKPNSTETALLSEASQYTSVWEYRFEKPICLNVVQSVQMCRRAVCKELTNHRCIPPPPFCKLSPVTAC